MSGRIDEARKPDIETRHFCEPKRGRIDPERCLRSDLYPHQTGILYSHRRNTQFDRTAAIQTGIASRRPKLVIISSEEDRDLWPNILDAAQDHMIAFD